jgi:hypothetical protein
MRHSTLFRAPAAVVLHLLLQISTLLLFALEIVKVGMWQFLCCPSCFTAQTLSPHISHTSYPTLSNVAPVKSPL